MSESGVEERIDELAKKLPNKLGVRKELKELPAMLGEGEIVESLAKGAYEGRQGLVVATDRRVIFFHKGRFSSEQEDLAYSKISSAKDESGMMSGTVKLHASGTEVKIDQVYPKQAAREIAELVRSKITEGASAHANTPVSPAAQASSPEERLTRLKSLLDSGVITPEEYDARRQAIIAEL